MNRSLTNDWYWERTTETELRDWVRERVRSILTESLDMGWALDADIQNLQFALDQFLLSYEDPAQVPPSPARRQLAGALQRWAWNANNALFPLQAAQAAHLCATLNRFAHPGDPFTNEHFKRMLGLFIQSRARLDARDGVALASARRSALDAIKSASLERPEEIRGQVPFWLKRRVDQILTTSFIEQVQRLDAEEQSDEIHQFLESNVADAFSLGLVDGQSEEGEILVEFCRRIAPELHKTMEEQGAFFHWREGIQINDELSTRIDTLAGEEKYREIARILDQPVRDYFERLELRIDRYVSYHEPTLSSKHFKLERMTYSLFDTARQMARRGEFEEAVSEFFSVFEHNVDNLMVESWLAYALANVGRESEAIDHWNHLARKPRATWCTHWNIGCAYYRQENPSTALEHFLKAHKINPQAPNVLSTLLVLGYKLKNWDAVVTAAESYPGPSLLPVGFWARMQASDTESAKKFLSQIQAGCLSGSDDFFLPPPEERLDENALRRVYSYFVSRHRIQLGINYFSKKCQYQGGFFLNHRFYGELLERDGKLNEALNEFETEMSMTLRARIPPLAKVPRLIEVLDLCRAYRRSDVALRLLDWASEAGVEIETTPPLKRLAKHFGFMSSAPGYSSDESDSNDDVMPQGANDVWNPRPEQEPQRSPLAPAAADDYDHAQPGVVEMTILNSSLPTDGKPTQIIFEAENISTEPITNFLIELETRPPGVMKIIEPQALTLPRIDPERRIIWPMKVVIDPGIKALETAMAARLTHQGKTLKEMPDPPVFKIPLEDFSASTGNLDGLPGDVYWFPNPLPVQRKDNFHGREILIRRVLSGITDRSQMFIPYLEGIRGVGKTSLMRFAADTAPAFIMPVYADMEVMLPNLRTDTLSTLYRALAHAVIEAIRKDPEAAKAGPLPDFDDNKDPEESFKRFLQDLTTELVKRDRVLLLMLDEFQNLAALERGLEGVLGILRGLNQGGVLALVLAGTTRYDHLSELGLGPIMRSIRPQPVGFLDRADADAALQVPAAKFNIRIHPEALDLAWELTRGYPYFIQALGVQVMDILSDQRRTGVYPFDIESAATDLLSADQLFMHIFPDEPLDMVENSLLHQMLSASLEGGKTAIDAEELKLRIPSELRRNAAHGIQQLISLGFFRLTQDNRYAVSMGLLQRWLMSRFKKSRGRTFTLPSPRETSQRRVKAPNGDCALFVDAENLLIGLRKAFLRDKGIDIFLQPMNYPDHIARSLLENAKKFGDRVVIKEAVANWDREELQALGPFAAAFGKYDFKVAYPANSKDNSTDFKLQSDVRATLNDPKNDNIGTYVIVGGDGDFQQIILDIQGQSRRAVVWGLGAETSHALIQSVGRENFAPVDQILGEKTAPVDGIQAR